MSRILLWSALVVPLGVATLLGDNGAAPPADEAEAMAARLMAAVRVIEREHYDPPPLQELVHRLIRSMKETPAGMGRELSSMTDDAELEAMLSQSCRDLIDRQANTTDSALLLGVEVRLLSDVLNSLPGPNMIRTRKDHIVDEQFANNRYIGTGIVLSMAGNEKIPQMAHVFPNGPAHRVGTKDGDLILEIDGVPTEGMNEKEVVDRLRGPEGSDVTLKLRQPNEDKVRELTITRGVVPRKHTTLERTEPTITIKTNTLTASTVQELRDIEEQLDESREQVVLDFKSVDGFKLHHAVMLADALLDGGDIGRVRTTKDVREYKATRDCLFRDRPLKVLVTENTSGAFEWVVAALQDNGRATVAGQRTAGRPYVTESFEVSGTDWVLVLTSGVLERADGRTLLRTQTQPSSDRPTTVWIRSEDGKLPPIIVPTSADDHDGGVLPDELVEPPQRRGTRRPVEPPDASDVRSFLHRFFRGRSAPE